MLLRGALMLIVLPFALFAAFAALVREEVEG